MGNGKNNIRQKRYEGNKYSNERNQPNKGQNNGQSRNINGNNSQNKNQSENAIFSFKSEVSDTRTHGSIGSWLKENNKRDKMAEVNISYKKKSDLFVLDKFGVGLHFSVDSNNVGKGIIRAINSSFNDPEAVIDVQNIEEVLKEGNRQLRLEAMPLMGNTRFLATLYDERGMSEKALEKSSGSNVREALQQMNKKLSKEEEPAPKEIIEESVEESVPEM